MPSSTSASGTRHRPHQTRNFPPREYTDLSKSDIALLAPTLAPSPASSHSSASASYQSNTRQLIANLPTHLRAKYPTITSFCKSHPLNPLPVIDFLRMVQKETSPQALEVWNIAETQGLVESHLIALLENVNALWMKPEDFLRAFGRMPSPLSGWTYQSHKCAACKLSQIARSPAVVLALGAILIARIENPGNWKKSKRILFFEEWLKSCIEWKHQADGAVQSMWETGTRLHKYLTEYLSKKADRSYIDEFIAKAKATSTVAPSMSPSPSSPQRYEPQAPDPPKHQQPAVSQSPNTMNPFDDPHNPDTLDVLFDDNDRAQARSKHGSAMPEPWYAARRSVASPVYSRQSEIDGLLRPDRGRSRPVASSLYSRPQTDEHMSWNSASSTDSEGQIIDAYRGSAVGGSRIEKRRLV